jgi:hypothetical protein
MRNHDSKLTLLISVICVSCSYRSMTTWSSTWNWDRDGDDKLDRYEFKAGYQRSNYFKSWGTGTKISQHVFLSSVFDRLDANADRQLSHKEFTERMNYYMPDRLTHFADWDQDCDNRVSEGEYYSGERATRLLAHWDISNDQKISEEEMATGMFSVSDLNGDQSITSLEFNIWKVNR